ncbi:WD repeat-containing protein 25 [Cololabis saira]|uniref:WD repeat-containing protein 25 n=1 Tax=Cololabis saira TaxID=129043 RepID=UPI002AD41074|nr:WD repeat-containing protein 25 [Cololabis saira]
MKMSSLVAYDDSDSEDDSFDQKKMSAAVNAQAVFYGQNQETIECINTKVLPSPASLTPDHGFLGYHGDIPERRSSSWHFSSQPQSHAVLEKNKRIWDNAALTSSSATEGKFASLQAAPCISKTPSDVSKPAKRQPAIQSVVRPYIPKRQRLATSVDTMGMEQPSEKVIGSHDLESQIVLNVSSRVKPYLSEKPRAAGIPRKLLMSLGGHQGPVNTVQWCPAPHLSHLLLSASMDKTFKVWDGAESGRCLRVYTCHSGAIRDACWTPCGRQLLTGSFDNTAVITNVETGQQAVKVDNQFRVMCVALLPGSPEVFLCGGYSSVVKAWDSRSSKVVKVYKAGIQQTLDILFLKGGEEFITSSDSVSRDSADRTLIAWDFQTTAKVSNQIYHERYTCPSLALHPLEESFVVQSNGNYLALFSSQRPYRMNKRRRFEGHKVEGYAVQCDFSVDGSILASGSSTGHAHFYDYHNARTLHTLQAHSQPCVSVAQHPVLPATAATCDWAGEIKIWH